MKTSAKWLNSSLIILVFSALLSLPSILTGEDGERAAGPDDPRLRQQEWMNLESQRLMARTRAQQAQMRQWNSDRARSERSAAETVKVKQPKNHRKAGGSDQ
jgi:hypothetical protein